MEEVFDYSPELIEDTNQYLVSNGCMFKADKSNTTYQYIPAPVALKPSAYPRDIYESLREKQISFNMLMEVMMQKMDLIYEILGPISQSDPFIASLIETSKAVRETPYHQFGYLGILRMDYMVTQDKQPKLVEMNTISSGLGAVGDKMADFYKFLIAKHYDEDRLSPSNLPTDNNNTEGFIDAMKEAHDLYVSSKKEVSHKTIMAYIVDYEEVNILDQRLIENALLTKHNLVSRRLTFEDIYRHCELKETGELIYKNKEEIAVVYYRSGYSPTQYKNEDDWKARTMLEKSLAIKTPSVDLQLLTFKKIQEVLSKQKVWDRLIGTQEYDEVQPFFKDQMWGFDEMNEETLDRISDAKANPHNYVLKTQREGGGNNYFGDDIPYILDQTDKLVNYSLMRKIEPKIFENMFLRNNKVYKGTCVSEIGIFGTLLVKFGDTKNREILVNQDTGFLLRTKGHGTNEGGVYGGFSFIDCAYLE